MCGIAGIFNRVPARDAAIDQDELWAMREHMETRGPDGAGTWIGPDRTIGLAHRRLAIIDPTPAGAQPMALAGTELVITFNGEIYNYRQLRAELEESGAQFTTNTDTEVLLHLYRARGAEMVHALRGMFAFAMWDGARKGLFLARDAFGIKPLYYADDGHTFRFASQVKALEAGGGVDTAVSAPGLAGFFLWGYVPEPYTIRRGIRALASGTTLWVDRDTPPRISRYFSATRELSLADTSQPISSSALRERLGAALEDSVRAHMIADVPVGVFLSSGLDSATITSLAVKSAKERLSAVTLGFEEYRGTENDEVPLAKVLAEGLKVRHTVELVSNSDFSSELDHLTSAMDQPSIDGVNTFFVSRAASRAGMKVALSGTGGDEIFGGYPSFRQIPKLVKLFGRLPAPAPLGAMFRAVSAPLASRFTSPKYAGLLEYGGSYGGAYLLRRGLFMPWELPHVMEPEMAREGWRALQTVARLERRVDRIRSPHAKVAALELRMYLRNQLLRDADWAGMAFSLEIRVPFVDVDLFRAVVPWISHTNPMAKLDMAAALHPPLPSPILARRKTGFSIPVQQWLVKAAGSEGKFRGERGYRAWARTVAEKYVAA